MAYQRVALHHVPEAVFLRVEFALLRARAPRQYPNSRTDGENDKGAERPHEGDR